MQRYVSRGIASVALMGCLFALRSPAGEKPDEKTKATEKVADRDTKSLEGEWMVVSAEDEGLVASDDDLKGAKWVIKGTEITATNPDGTTDRITFKVDPGKKPKAIDLTFLDGSDKGKTEAGIYELEGRRLRVCYRLLEKAEKGRPSKFATAPDSGLGIVTLEKRER
jgi:uncharacterized protein (TIGR03067 family)